MPTFEDLKAAAFRKEIAKAQRRAQSENITPEEALRRLLEMKAKGKSLDAFIQSRNAQKKAERMRAEANRKAEEGAWRAWFDGAAEPNPGQRGIGALLKGPNGERIEISQAIGHGTNNEAEYRALIAVLEAAITHTVDYLIVHGDSRLVISQVTETWSVDSPRLFGLCEHAQSLARKLKRVNLFWIPREQNSEADALSKKAIGYIEASVIDKRQWTNQTEIAKPLGLSAIALGKKMDAAGLRKDGKPTREAIELGVALVTENRFGYQVSWHRGKLVTELRKRHLVPAVLTGMRVKPRHSWRGRKARMPQASWC